MNEDKVIDKEDLELLIKQAIGEEDADLDKGDFIKDDKIDYQDVAYLDQVIKNNNWNIVINSDTKEVSAKLNVNSDEITSGDEFTVDYIVTVEDFEINGVSGLIDYDKETLELIDVKSELLTTGANYEGKYLYLTDDSLVAETTQDDNQNVITKPTDYTLLTLTFRALKEGNSTVKLTQVNYFNQDQNYNNNEDVMVDVTVNASSDDSLASLKVGNEEIKLEDDVLEYEVTVPNEVTNVEIEAVLNNLAAKLSVVSGPEVLAEGENVYTIVVTAENGDERTYTIKVNREASPKEENVDTYAVTYVEEPQQETDSPVVTQPKDDDGKKVQDDDNVKVKGSNLSRIVIIVLILLVIAGLIYLIFKDDDDDEEKKANKDINRMKKDDIDSGSKKYEHRSQNNNKNKKGR